MAVNIIKEKYSNRINEVVIGTGPHAVKAGGDSTLPFLLFEGEMPNRPLAALEIWDIEPKQWPEILTSEFEGVMSDPAAWAGKCEEYGADLICLTLASSHPDNLNSSPAQCAETARAVADAVKVPLIIMGCGVEEKDVQVIGEVCRVLEGRNCLVGCAKPDNYKTITASCIVHGHSLIASNPLDINIAKQLNILVTEMGLSPNRIVIDPLGEAMDKLIDSPEIKGPKYRTGDGGLTMAGWGEVKKQMRNFIKFLRDTKKNVIIVSHVSEIQNDQTIEHRIQVATKLSDEIPNMVDVISYLGVRKEGEDYKRVLYTPTQGSNFDSKDRTGTVPMTVEIGETTGWQDLMNAMKGEK